ncbi:hypothetical protein HK101_008979 [Irineochytrium annulatum]|nr:hypothetical protein HK101_008979 [Irineochytrium annulatum]
MGGMGMPDMGGLGAGADPAMMSQMMQNPAFAAMASQLFSNPQFLDAMVASNPEMAGMMTPQVRQMMQSPQFRAMMSDPNMVRQMMQMAPMMGGGMNPFAAGMGGGAPGGTDGGAGAGAPGMNPTGAGAFDPALLSMLMGGGMRGGAAALPPPPANPEEAYQEQLRQLQDMGFYDASENIRALTATRGNASAAVEWLLNNPPGGPR